MTSTIIFTWDTMADLSSFVFILTAPGSRIELQFWDLFEREILAYLEFNF